MAKEKNEKINIKNNSKEKPVIGVCHTCRSRIFQGEILWSSSTTDSTGYTTGTYGGASHAPEGSSTTYHGGVYGARHTGSAETENWIQCGFCYDEWEKEKKKLEEWKSKETKWAGGLAVLGLVLGGLAGYFIFPLFLRELESNKSTGLTMGAVLGAILGYLIGKMIVWSKFGSKPQPDRYRRRTRPMGDEKAIY